MYGETLGRWRTADLLIGLAYLARREREEHPIADIAGCGELIGSRSGQTQRIVLVGPPYQRVKLAPGCTSLPAQQATAQQRAGSLC